MKFVLSHRAVDSQVRDFLVSTHVSSRVDSIEFDESVDEDVRRRTRVPASVTHMFDCSDSLLPVFTTLWGIYTLSETFYRTLLRNCSREGHLKKSVINPPPDGLRTVLLLYHFDRVFTGCDA
jgi:hypothetical protein